MSANTRFETLSDIARKSGNLAVGCSGCQRHAVISGTWLSRIYAVQRWDGRVPFIRDRLRCARCGARPDLVRVTHQVPTLNRPPRTEAEWRQLATRSEAWRARNGW